MITDVTRGVLLKSMCKQPRTKYLPRQGVLWRTALASITAKRAGSSLSAESFVRDLWSRYRCVPLDTRGRVQTEYASVRKRAEMMTWSLSPSSFLAHDRPIIEVYLSILLENSLP